MSKKDPRYDTSKEILKASLESFRLPTPMSKISEDELWNLSRLVWALQIMMRDVISELDILGNASGLVERLERLERMLAFSKGIMTSEEVCEQLGICKSQLYKLVSTRDLPTFKPSGKMMYFKVEDVVDWVTEHPLQRGSRPIEETGLIKTVNDNDE